MPSALRFFIIPSIVVMSYIFYSWNTEGGDFFVFYKIKFSNFGNP